MKKIPMILLLAVLICASGTVCTSCRGAKDTGSVQSVTVSQKRKTEKTTDGLDTDTQVSFSSSGTESEAPQTADNSLISIINPSKDVPKANDTDALLFSGDGISVYYRDVTGDSLYTTVLFFVTNASNASVRVKINVLAINQYAFGGSSSAELTPFGAGIVEPYISIRDLELAGITGISDISEITVRISFLDENYMPIRDDQSVTFVINTNGRES